MLAAKACLRREWRRGGSAMKHAKRNWFGLALVFSSMVLSTGCAMEAYEEGSTGDQNGEGTVQQEVDNGQTPGVGESCHVTETGVSNGTMNINGWCCGVSRCNDQETCGDEYGNWVPTCSDCSHYECRSGAYKPAPPITVPIVPTTPPKKI
jgi:hypothetical protein